MREILFKAKAQNTDGTWSWEEGYLSKCENQFIICDDDGVGVFVDENTICQYTGLTDKNGNKIWENDVVRIKYVDNFSEVGWVKYSNCGVRYNFVVGVEIYSFDESCDIEVIGNTLDNPELMNATETIGYADNAGLMSAT